MPWTLDRGASRAFRRDLGAGAPEIVRALVVLSRPAAEATPDDPATAVTFDYRRQFAFDEAGDVTGQTAGEFRTLLLGAGTVDAPQGEVGAWLAHLNAAGGDEEIPL